MKIRFAAFVATLALAACGGEQSGSENMAESLEEAAEYSTPAAADVLVNEADRVRETNVQDPAAAHEALEAAGNAQTNQTMTNSQGAR